MIEQREGVDDLARYQERYTSQEREELKVASLALDMAFLLARARREHGRDAIVTIAVPAPHDVDREALARYLCELGYDLKLTPQEMETGRYIEAAPARRSRWSRYIRPRRLAPANC